MSCKLIYKAPSLTRVRCRLCSLFLFPTNNLEGYKDIPFNRKFGKLA